MPFNSYVFILSLSARRPAVYVFVRRHAERAWTIAWLVLASLFYYAWWKPQFLILLLLSITVNAVNVVFALTPNHAYDDYYLDSVGAWKTVEEWLTRLSAEGTVYSFSQPNAWVYEPVGHHMTYWKDPYHFSLNMGRAMQRALAGITDRDAPDNFMMRMTPDKVHAHIRSRREAIRRWGQDNPDFVARFTEERRTWGIEPHSREQELNLATAYRVDSEHPHG